MQESRTPLEERASRGIRLVASKNPDWRSKINTQRFGMQFTGYCLLGQIFGSFENGMKTLGLEPGDDGIAHGFQIAPREMTPESIEEWNRIFKKLIESYP